MLKKMIVVIVLYILLASCEKVSETTQIKQPLKVIEQTEQLVINENFIVDQAANTKSAMEKINPSVLESLDVLTDYNREFTSGPEDWDDELWSWKILLKWDQRCDYGPSVAEYPLSESQYIFVIVQCTGGAYQAMSYAFLLDENTKENVQLELGQHSSVKEIWGDIEIEVDTSTLSILSVSRGGGDCGAYRKFHFVPGDTVNDSNFELQSVRKQECLVNPADVKKLPYSVTDYKNWPIVGE